MDFLAAVLAGLAGTALMTAWAYVSPAVGLPRMPLLQVLGALFTDQGPAVLVLGVVLHFAMGVVFALFYAWLWSLGIGAPTWGWGLLFGAMHGVVAIVAMSLLLKVHPRPPVREMGPGRMAVYWIAHLLFGATVAVTYAAL